MLRTLKKTINVLHLIVTKLITFTFILVTVTAYSEHTSSTHNIYIYIYRTAFSISHKLNSNYKIMSTRT